MAYELKDGQGSLFNNDRKQTDNQPDMTGKVMLDGRLYYVSAWNKNSGRGDWLSLSVQPADQQQGRQRQGGNRQQRPQNTGQRRGGGYGGGEEDPGF